MLNKLSTCLLALGLLLGASGNAHAELTPEQVSAAVSPCYSWAANSPVPIFNGHPSATACRNALRTLSGQAELNDVAQDTQRIYNVARALNFPGATMALQPTVFGLVILPWKAAAACITAGGQVGDICAPPNP